LTDPDGKATSYTVSGGSGMYSISNLSLDVIGQYTLVIHDANKNYSVYGILKVIGSEITITGSLILNDANSAHQVKVTVADERGNLLIRQQITVDGTPVGADTKILTTDASGSVSFSMIPARLGDVNVLINGHIIGTIPVTAAYSAEGRIGGNTSSNIAMSIEIAKQGWNSANTVILTREDSLSDAMTAVPLAKKLDAPILMTQSDCLDSTILTEMNNLGTHVVWIMGGTDAISANVENYLKSVGLSVYRLAGTDRYDTAAKIAAYLNSNGTVYLAYGYGEPDTVALCAFAAQQGAPILLTDKDKLPEATLNAIGALNPSKIVLIGGTGIIDLSLENSLKKTYSVERWGGADRFNTEQIIFQHLFDIQSPQSSVYFASSSVCSADVLQGEKPRGDALLVAALAAKNNGFVITLPHDSLPSAINYFLLYNKGYITQGTFVGNTLAISGALEEKLSTMLYH
ncbi:MAG: cell wall-binding repeat-containing protein, partial [Eubacteriales bacterium]